MPETMEIKISDIDLIFVSYEEPGRDIFYDQAKKMWTGSVKHVDGIKGIHNAYSKADEIASTEWFMIVDGDTWLWDTMSMDRFFLPKQETPCVYSFGSINEVNRLCYGNGGPKLWKKGLISTGKTHSKTESGISLDFFTTFKYYQIDQTFSTTVINQSPLQAVRAGYRESVKFLSQNGKIGRDWAAVKKAIAGPNLSRLHIWCSTGSDIENGYWAIYGARRGILDFWGNDISNNRLFMEMDEIDRYLILNDYDTLNKYLLDAISSTQEPMVECMKMGDRLFTELGFYTPLHDERMSAWMKMVYQNPSRGGFI